MWFEDRSWNSNAMKGSSVLVEEEWRDIWASKLEMLVATLAYLFATTNMLNLPALILNETTGGMPFLIAYGVSLLVVILPIIVLELCVGQLTGRAPIQALYNISPVFKGVGVAQILFALLVMACMTRFLASVFIFIYYLFWTVFEGRQGLPWLQCADFGDIHRLSLAQSFSCVDTYTVLSSPTTTTSPEFGTTSSSGFGLRDSRELLLPPGPDYAQDDVLDEGEGGGLINASSSVMALKSAASAFAFDHGASTLASTSTPHLAVFDPDSALSHFIRSIEWPSASIAEITAFRLELLIAQAVVWVLVLAAIWYGVRWLGKVMAFTLGVPAILLLLFAARVQFLDGALDLYPELWNTLHWEKLQDYRIWALAIRQAILATGVGFGAFITIGSYNKRSNNLVGDSFLFVFGHALFSVLQLATVFGLLGFVARQTALSPGDLFFSGERAFHQLLVYVAQMPLPRVFTGTLLFITAFVLLNIFYVLALGVLASLEDALGERWSRCCPRFTLALFVCVFGAALSLPFATDAGHHIYQLTVFYARPVTVFVLLAAELFAVAYIYCAHMLGKDLKTMLEAKASWCFGHFLLFLNHLLVAVPIAIIVFNVAGYSFFGAHFSPAVRDWRWSELCGLAVAFVPLLPIPIYALATVVSSCRNLPRLGKCQRFCFAFRSPMRYELVKGGGMSGGGGENGAIAVGGGGGAIGEVTYRSAHSPRYSSSTPGAGYVLLSQAQAPLAQPEPVGGEAGGGGGSDPTATNVTVVSHRLSSSTTQHHQQQNQGVFV